MTPNAYEPSNSFLIYKAKADRTVRTNKPIYNCS